MFSEPVKKRHCRSWWPIPIVWLYPIISTYEWDLKPIGEYRNLCDFFLITRSWAISDLCHMGGTNLNSVTWTMQHKCGRHKQIFYIQSPCLAKQQQIQHVTSLRPMRDVSRLTKFPERQKHTDTYLQQGEAPVSKPSRQASSVCFRLLGTFSTYLVPHLRVTDTRTLRCSSSSALRDQGCWDGFSFPLHWYPTQHRLPKHFISVHWVL